MVTHVTDLLATLTLGEEGGSEKTSLLVNRFHWRISDCTPHAPLTISAEYELSMVMNIDISDAEWIASLCVPPCDGPAQFITCGSHRTSGHRRWLHGDCKCSI